MSAILARRSSAICCVVLLLSTNLQAAEWTAIRLAELFNDSGKYYVLRNGSDFGLPNYQLIPNLLTLKPQCAGVTSPVEGNCYQHFGNPHVAVDTTGNWLISGYGVWKPPFPQVCDAIGVDALRVHVASDSIRP